MAYYISKPSIIDSKIIVYYAGANRWSDNISERVLFATEESANAIRENPDGKNGGWRNSTIKSE
jgi:hypothetical protein